jgi:phosphopantothenoylcysteine synthetase/decarboxylase
MRILVTAGNTQTPIDEVRCLTNIFTGRTGARIAVEAYGRDHDVVLLTSHPETVADTGMVVRRYRTFDDLHALLADLVPSGGFDAIIHSAAVSDYALAGVFPDRLPLSASERGLGEEVSGKIKSTHPELWMRFVPTPKLVDFVRSAWQFRGVLVKFKLEVGIGDDELLAIGRKSRAQSDADLLVANTLDGYEREAFLIDRTDSAERVARSQMPARLLDRIEGIFSAPDRRRDVK